MDRKLAAIIKRRKRKRARRNIRKQTYLAPVSVARLLGRMPRR